MKAAVLVEDLFDERELIYPLYRLKELGFQVDIVGPEAKEYKGKSELRVKATLDARSALNDDYLVLWIPGGYAPDRLRRSAEILELVRKTAKKGIIAAVCHAPWVLISAGLVRGRKVTGFFSIHDDLRNAGAEVMGENFVRDGNIITGTDPEAMPGMFKLLLEALREKGLTI
ncbi:MAG: type 1 glutamine amidotransferase domain-containing protein [Infirmifilum sp.]